MAPVRQARASRRFPLCILVALAACGGGGGGPTGADPALGTLPPLIPDGVAVALSGRWVASRNLEITVYEGTKPVRTLTTGHHDYKPVWSPDTDEIVFFRALRDSGDFAGWQTRICVVHADGTGLRCLTDGTHRDFNPTWTRDGTHRILFNRYAEGGDAAADEVWWTASDAAPGDEVRLDQRARYAWVDAGLPDGRLFVDWSTFAPWGQRSFLFTPGEAGGEVELARPAYHYWHKLSVSPSLTRVAYMVDLGYRSGDYSDDVIYWAELDLPGLAVKNPVLITPPYADGCVNEYPRWSPDETLVVFDSSCRGPSRAYAYRLSDGVVFPFSDDPGAWISFVDFEHTPQ